MGHRLPEGLIAPVELAAAFKFGLDPLSWDIVSTLNLGPLEISPHGIGIALGYLAGAQLMVRRARRLGGPDENDIWNTLFWALLGAIAGARIGYVIGHFSEVTDGGDDLLGVFRIWEGGISLLGGITGAVLAALPHVLKKRMGFWRTIDLAAPGLALGIVIGRIGDLVIGDHLGKPTTFALGWLCSGESGTSPEGAQVYRSALERGEPPSLGCFDLVLHQTALYDFFSTLLLLGVLLWVGRRVRNLGMLTLIFVTWYGTMRVITDFLRVDRRYLGLTGSQILSLVTVAIGLYLLARYRGAPPRFAGAGGPGLADDPDDGGEVQGPDAKRDQEQEKSGHSAPPGDSP
ncbi:MAG: prolipoprotein diacylglyceryl transferase [Actinomycetota bacterium]|nr:prolipoprotein diacylglyceryl transferase [Actinomycetota bacterium]